MRERDCSDGGRWLCLPVALALAGSVIAAFADAVRERRTAVDLRASRPRGGALGIEAETDEVLRAHDRDWVGPFDVRAAGATSGLKARVVRLAARRRWRWLGRVLQVQQRFGELRGNDLAASVTLQAFLALFPLLLVAIAVLGFLQANSTDFSGRVVENLGLHGSAADTVRNALSTAAGNRRTSTVIGVLGLAWSGLGVTGALRYAYNRAWQVQDRGLRDKATGVLWILGAGVIFAASIAVTAVVQFLPGVLAPVGILAGVLVSLGLFLWTARILPNVDVGWRPLVPGAVLGAFGFEVLKALGTILVPRMVASSSTLYGTLGVVFALLAWLLLFGRLVVYTAVCNVVLYEAHEGTVLSTVRIPRHAGATREANRSGLSLPDAPRA